MTRINNAIDLPGFQQIGSNPVGRAGVHYPHERRIAEDVRIVAKAEAAKVYFRAQVSGDSPWRMTAYGNRYDDSDGWTTIATRILPVADVPSHIESITLYLEAALRNAAHNFDRTLLRIERHRMSTTQGEYSIYYGDRHVGRFGDEIRLTDAGWRGSSDEVIEGVARRIYREGVPGAMIHPIYLAEKIDEIASGHATLMTMDEYTAIAPELGDDVLRVGNRWADNHNDQYLVGTKTAVGAIDPASVAVHTLDSLVHDLNASYPQANLTLGYIGNVHHDRDDRSWMVWAKVDGQERVRWGNFATSDLPTFATTAQASLEGWVRCVVGIDEWPKRTLPRTRGMER